MEFPKLDFNRPESFIAVYVPLVVAITLYPRNVSIPEYLYFYLCNMRLLLTILAIILTISVILRIYTNPIHRSILKIILIYSILMGFYWYRDFSLSFEDAAYSFRSTWLPVIIGSIIMCIIMFGSVKIISKLLSSYDGDSRIIIIFKEVNDLFSTNEREYDYYSNGYTRKEEDIEGLKLFASILILILVSLSVLYLPSILSSSSPRFYDIYAIHGDINAEMKEEYPVDKIIYVPVETGGLDTGLSLTLSKYNSGKFDEISSLVLHPNEVNTQVSDSLSGRARNSGNYEVYLDPKSMPTGDYELIFENAQNKNISVSKVFSLART